MLHLLVIPAGTHVGLSGAHIILKFSADPEENHPVRPLLHDKAVGIASERNLLQLLIDGLHLPLRIPDGLVNLGHEIVHKGALQLFRLLFQLLAGFLNLHMGQIPVFFPVKSNVTHAALIDVKLGKAAVFQLGAFQMFFTFFDITPGIIHTSLGNYLEGSVLLFTKLLILFQHRRFKLQMKLAFFLIFLFS